MCIRDRAYTPQSRRRYLTVMYASSTHRNVEAGFFMFRERRNDLSERNQRKASPNSRRRILSPRANMARSRKPARRRILPLPAACILRTKVRRRRPEIPRASMARSPPINSDRIRSGPAPPTIYGRRKKRAEAKDRNLMRRRPGLTGPERNALPGRNRTRRRRHKAKRIRREMCIRDR